MLGALHVSYHEAITQLEYGFTHCELPNEVTVLVSCRLPLQLLAGSLLLI